MVTSTLPILLRYGALHYREGRHEDAIACYRSALAGDPGNAHIHHAIGEALAAQHRFDDAADAYREAVALNPGLTESWNNIGTIFQNQNRLLDALDAYHHAVALRPAAAAIHYNIGSTLHALNRHEDAVASYRHALALQPDFAQGHYVIGESLAAWRRPEEAIASFSRALELDPDHTAAFVARVDQRRHVCDWRDYESERDRLLALARNGEKILPFRLRAAGASAADMLAAARREMLPVEAAAAARFTHAPRAPHGRLRVGYLSSDFHEHPVALLAAELFEQHDRSRFELFAYSHGADDGSATRQRIARAFEHFVDVRPLSDAAAADRIHADGIDVLVDLNGFTFGTRPAILAQRPAPVQASWLGYIGTSGAKFIDYVIADPFAVPAGQQPFYIEQILSLSHCYLPIDNTREIPPPTPSRESFGLPATGAVFCCFNNSYKLTPEMFATWMRILARVPGSVLWLLGAPPVVANLRREAAAAGIAPERLVFARSIPLPDYLARFRAADLFLDTLPCSACTTGSDALFAGLPILTCAGDIFAGRHSGSMLRAAGLPDLVTDTLSDYEELAVRLATEGGLGELKQRLERNRASAPLFDTRTFARDLEKIFLRMAALHAAGAPPSAFAPSALPLTRAG